MARITVEDCLEEVENRFLLVHLAARRAKQLREGSRPLVDSPENKDVVKALREIADGKVNFDNINEMSIPEEDPFDAYRDEPVEKEVKEEAEAMTEEESAISPSEDDSEKPSDDES